MSEFTPPVLEGIAIMLYNLFSFFPPDSVCMLTDDPSKRKSQKDNNMQLPFKHYIVRVPNFSFWFVRSANLRVLLQYCYLPFILFRGMKIIKAEKIDKIFSVNSRGPYFVAAYYLHRITKRPLYVYMFDLWASVLNNHPQIWIANKYERKILQSARMVFVMSENLAHYYKDKYSINAEVFYHSFIKNDIEAVQRSFNNKGDNIFFDIVFTGAVNSEIAWFKKMQEVIEDLANYKIRLRLCVPYKGDLENLNNNIIVDNLDRKDVLIAQKKADILYLPIYFSEYEKSSQLRSWTASPSKLGEYLISGVPILVHAPKDSYVSDYATKAGWALVVNNFHKESLINAILKLKNDAKLRKSLVTNALIAAKEHDAEILSKKMQHYLL